MAWIRIEQSLVQNRKLYSLKSALRIDTAKAVGTLALLWLWAIDNARGGSLGRISDRQLAEICQFSPRRAAELRDAQQHPERHRSLRVRMSGFSDYFVNLNADLQSEIVKRTEQA